MATKTKKAEGKSQSTVARSRRAKAAATAKKVDEAPVLDKKELKTKAAVPFDDVHTQRDDQAVPGHFADVVDGKHKGRYGVVVEVASRDANGVVDEVVLRTRDDDSGRIVVRYKDLRPARAGKR